MTGPINDLSNVPSAESRNGVPCLMWCYWSEGPLSEVRKLSLEYLVKHVGVPVFLVTKESFYHLEKAGSPIHPAFRYLSAVHQSDYVRSYLWHHYGGAWHDVKATEVNFLPTWEEFLDPSVYLVGRPEAKGGAAKIADPEGRWMPKLWKDLVSVIAWIGRPHTSFSFEMMENLNHYLDQQLEALANAPALHPREKKIETKNFLIKELKQKYYRLSGRSPGYPLPWTLFGNIFHPLNYKYKEHVSIKLPQDQRKNAGIYHR
ncbi:MAG: hypothetical protein JJU34_10265 [Lunatimonas sp.]|uniref:hypothetical protein n=1 Tax=Lunatimonas sp. TaxID=2060141 RepID=UPI00263AFFF8|nr:hypothetical protein [Lunatimonas sp.]MCC5937657.1 hypothetical protein [Lunatimonas sp.]